MQHLLKQDKETYEMLQDYNNQLESDPSRLRVVDKVFEHIQNTNQSQHIKYSSADVIMKQLPPNVYATKNEIQGRMKVYWETKS